MPIDNVSSYSVYQSTLSDMAKLAQNLAISQGQISSGNKAQDFSGLGAQAQQYLSLESSIARTDQYLDNNRVIDARLATTNNVLDQVTTIANSLQNLIILRRNSSLGTLAFSQQIEGYWQSLAGGLNSNINGRYLFSGSKTDTPPVDPTAFPTVNADDTLNSNYYHGNNQDMTIRAEDNVTLTYNIRADNPAIQKIVQGLALAKKGDENNNDELLAKAYELVHQGAAEIAAAQATVGANKVALININDNHQTMKLYWQGLKEDIGNTDIVAVSTQVAINQGILQASFQMFAKINALRLSDYLK